MLWGGKVGVPWNLVLITVVFKDKPVISEY